MGRPERSPEELRLASEHVAWEIERLFGNLHDYMGIQRAHYAGENPSPWTREALLDSWTIHLRNTMHFVRGSSPKPSDVLAADYFSGDRWWTLLAEAQSGWSSAAWGQSEELDESTLARRIDDQVVRLTYDRIHAASDVKNWQIGAITIHLGRDLQLFVDNVPAGVVVEDFAVRAQNALDTLR